MTIDTVLTPLFGDPGRPWRIDDCPETVCGWDSTKQIELIVAIEDACAIELTTDEIMRLRSVGALVDILRGRGIEARL